MPLPHMRPADSVDRVYVAGMGRRRQVLLRVAFTTAVGGGTGIQTLKQWRPETPPTQSSHYHVSANVATWGAMQSCVIAGGAESYRLAEGRC